MSETETPVVHHPLRAWRLRVGMTQAQLAQKTGVSEATISRIEDRGFATAEVMWAIVEATGGAVKPETILAECPFCRRPMAGNGRRKPTAA